MFSCGWRNKMVREDYSGHCHDSAETAMFRDLIWKVLS